MDKLDNCSLHTEGRMQSLGKETEAPAARCSLVPAFDAGKTTAGNRWVDLGTHCLRRALKATVEEIKWE